MLKLSIVLWRPTCQNIGKKLERGKKIFWEFLGKKLGKRTVSQDFLKQEEKCQTKIPDLVQKGSDLVMCIVKEKCHTWKTTCHRITGCTTTGSDQTTCFSELSWSADSLHSHCACHLYTSHLLEFGSKQTGTDSLTRCFVKRVKVRETKGGRRRKWRTNLCHFTPFRGWICPNKQINKLGTKNRTRSESVNWVSFFQNFTSCCTLVNPVCPLICTNNTHNESESTKLFVIDEYVCGIPNPKYTYR